MAIQFPKDEQRQGGVPDKGMLADIPIVPADEAAPNIADSYVRVDGKPLFLAQSGRAAGAAPAGVPLLVEGINKESVEALKEIW